MEKYIEHVLQNISGSLVVIELAGVFLLCIFLLYFAQKLKPPRR